MFYFRIRQKRSGSDWIRLRNPAYFTSVYDLNLQEPHFGTYLLCTYAMIKYRMYGKLWLKSKNIFLKQWAFCLFTSSCSLYLCYLTVNDHLFPSFIRLSVRRYGTGTVPLVVIFFFCPPACYTGSCCVRNRNTANSLHSGIFGRGGLSTNSVSSLVRLALSTNFPSGLLNQVPTYGTPVQPALVHGLSTLCLNVARRLVSPPTYSVSGPVLSHPQFWPVQ